MNPNNALHEHELEITRTFVGYSTLTLKSVILINGGAAVALLAFMGNVWDKSSELAVIYPLTKAIAFFAYGVLAGAFGAGTTYFTQWFYAQKWKSIGKAFHIGSIIIILLAYILFGFGVYEVYTAFNRHFASVPLNALIHLTSYPVLNT